MEKIKINLDIVLPEIPDEKDECVQRIMRILQTKKGIEKVHIVSGTENTKAQLCFHYNPDHISIEEIEKMTMKAGAEITARYKHLLVDLHGIRNATHARIVENTLKDLKGVLAASVSSTGWISLEFDNEKISKEQIHQQFRKLKLHPAQHHLHEHKESTDHTHGHTHDHNGIFGENSELIFSIICGILLASGFGISFIKIMPSFVPIIFYCCAYFFGGFYTTKEALEAIRKGGFEIDFLMLVAAIGAAVLGEWAEGALLLFLFSMSHSLEHYALGKARKSIEALINILPNIAILKKDELTKEVSIEELKPGDIIIVKPNTKIAADGILIKGNSSVNQASITGESIPVEKFPIDENSINIAEADKLDNKHKVFAGTLNGNNSIEIKVTRISSDSTISRLVKMVNEAQTKKSPTQNFTDKFERYFVPTVLIVVLLLCFSFLIIDEPFSKSFYRAMAVLVAASPCALAISTPSAVLSALARAAREGVLIKGGKALEDLGSLSVVAFDKTGTLTEGKPKLTLLLPLNGIRQEELLKIVVAVESLSDHPLAKAIVRDAKESSALNTLLTALDMEVVLGKGVKAKLGNDIIYIGNLALFEKLDSNIPNEELIKKIREAESEGNTTMMVRKNHEYIGIVALMDTARTEALETLSKLKQIGIKRMMLLSGDNQQVAEAIAKQVGIREAFGNLLPEQKVEAIKKIISDNYKIAMVGDGVNDAPAMATSTVGIAMGAAGSDVAMETADIALMGDKLSLLPFAIGLSRKAKSIIKQNLIISLGMVVILIPLTISGIATMGPAVLAHEGSTLLVVFNALRLLKSKL
jgi:Cd2+/Zn2+-exporting ATPase